MAVELIRAGRARTQDRTWWTMIHQDKHRLLREAVNRPSEARESTQILLEKAKHGLVYQATPQRARQREINSMSQGLDGHRKSAL